MQIFNSLFPIFAIIILGFVLFRRQILATDHLETLNRLTFRIGISCLLFYKVATADYINGQTNRVFLVVLVGMVATMLLAYLIAWLLRIDWETTGTFVQVAFRGNLTFIGLPVVIYALSGIYGADADHAETQAIFILAPAIPINSSLAVIVLLISQHKLGWQALKPVILSLISNPLLIAIALGGMVGILELPVPHVIMRSCDLIGQMALPLALIAIGGSLASIRLTGSIGLAVVATALKLLAAPALGLLAAKALALPPEQTKIALIYLACPTAALSYVLTNQIGGDDALAASTVVISTVFAVFSLGAVLML